LKNFKRSQVLCCGSYSTHLQNSSLSIQCQSGTIIRRQVLFQTIIAAFSFPPIVSIALADSEVLGDFRLYSDEVNRFKIMIPQDAHLLNPVHCCVDWQVGSGDNNGIKSVTGFFPAEPSRSNVTVAITGLGPDFTRLESFGKVDEFAETLVSGLDRSWQRPPGVKAKLIDSKAANGNPLLFWLHSSSLTMMVIVQPRKGRCQEFCSAVPFKTPSSTSLRKLKACRSLRVDCINAYTLVTICSTYLPGLYYIDYTLQNPGETLRHLFTVLGMATTGWYNRLYTVTGQYVDEDSLKYGSKIEKVSFKDYNFLSSFTTLYFLRLVVCPWLLHPSDLSKIRR
ncbi:hypothetical protein C3L33_11287, partial [Rhododendron williamsianum]